MEANIWPLVTIIGPILFLVVALYVIISNRRNRKPEDLARTEQATRELHRQLDEEDKTRIDGSR